MKIKDLTRQADWSYMNYMQAGLRAIPTEKRVASTDQAPSTQKLLEMSDAELEEYRKRPLVAARANDANIETDYYAAVGARQISELEFMIEDGPSGRRRKEKNTLGDAVSYGASGHSKESLETITLKLDATIPPEQKHDYKPVQENKGRIRRLFEYVFGKTELHAGVKDNSLTWREWVETYERENK